MNKSSAIYHIIDIKKRIDILNKELKYLNMSRRVSEAYLVSTEGGCEECQNQHWPPCGSKIEDYL